MRALVTGATGFLGGYLVKALRARGDAVVGVGRNPLKLQALTALGAQAIQVDLLDRPAVSRACAGVDVAFHTAALSAPWGRYVDFHAANVIGTRHVVSACIEQRISRLVHVSSPAVTFDGRDQVEIDESTPFPARYPNAYCATKKLAEDVVNAARDELDAVIIRPKAIFGPGDSSLLPRIIDAARSGRLPQIGDGSNRVDLTYVENVVRALLLAADSRTATGRTYFVTNGEHVALWPLLRRILGVYRLRTVSRIPFSLAYAMAGLMEWRAHRVGVEPRLTRYTVAILGRTQTYNIAAAGRDLKYTPEISVEQGVSATLEHLGLSA
jgi:nucleoside-diphosphate-sugar epimerase